MLKIVRPSIYLEIHVPKPRLCFNCQWYGHVKAECNRETTCARCSKRGHDYQACLETPLCLHCQQNHPSSDRKCPMYEIEKLILVRKFRTKSTFQEARKYVYSAYPDLIKQIPRLKGPSEWIHLCQVEQVLVVFIFARIFNRPQN